MCYLFKINKLLLLLLVVGSFVINDKIEKNTVINFLLRVILL